MLAVKNIIMDIIEPIINDEELYSLLKSEKRCFIYGAGRQALKMINIFKIIMKKIECLLVSPNHHVAFSENRAERAVIPCFDLYKGNELFNISDNDDIIIAVNKKNYI